MGSDSDGRLTLEQLLGLVISLEKAIEYWSEIDGDNDEAEALEESLSEYKDILTEFINKINGGNE